MGIENRVALITGSASGIGKRTARRLAESGAKVVINDIQTEKVEETVAELKRTVSTPSARWPTSPTKPRSTPWSRTP